MGNTDKHRRADNKKNLTEDSSVNARRRLLFCFLSLLADTLGRLQCARWLVGSARFGCAVVILSNLFHLDQSESVNPATRGVDERLIIVDQVLGASLVDMDGATSLCAFHSCSLQVQFKISEPITAKA